MGIYRGPNITRDGLVLIMNADSGRSYMQYPQAVEVLVIAGGGGGGTGSNGGGGGGAGGLLHSSSYSLSGISSVSITVGAGGLGTTGRGSGTNGGNSIFGSLTSIGGGRGGGHPTSGGSVSPNSGGSGGGGSYSTAGASGTANQGFAGGSGASYLGLTLPTDSAGGGGGAYEVGENGKGSSGGGGAGGDGLSYTTSGTATYYAGGGAGATNDMNTRALGGSGGGGNGGTPATKNGDDGLANTGSGGGGGNGGGGNSGAGGSGVVIIKYLGGQKALGGTITAKNGYTIHTLTSSGTFISSTTWEDLSGNNINGALSSSAMASAVPGEMRLNNTSDDIQFGHNILLEPPSITVSAWVNLLDIGDRHILITKWLGFSFEISAGGYPYFRLNGPGDQYSSEALVWGNWYNIVGTFNTTTKKHDVYVNGVNRGTSTKSSAISYNQGSFNIPYTGNPGYALGAIASLSIYNRDITAAEVLQNFNAQKSRFGL